MTLSEYIKACDSVLSPPLSGPELRWAANAMEGGIEPKKFAGWLALTAKASASSPLLTPPPRQGGGEGEPPPGDRFAGRGTGL
jgi:hypothetical protein